MILGIKNKNCNKKRKNILSLSIKLINRVKINQKNSKNNHLNDYLKGNELYNLQKNYDKKTKNHIFIIKNQ